MEIDLHQRPTNNRLLCIALPLLYCRAPLPYSCSVVVLAMFHHYLPASPHSSHLVSDHRAAGGTDKNDHADVDSTTKKVSGSMDKHHVDTSLNSKGVCLDGSTPVFWHRKGVGVSADKWLIHMKGGGWCTTDAECAGWVTQRFQAGTGVQEGGDGDGDITYSDDGTLPNNVTGVGIMSVDPSVNPLVSHSFPLCERAHASTFAPSRLPVSASPRNP